MRKCEQLVGVGWSDLLLNAEQQPNGAEQKASARLTYVIALKKYMYMHK